MSVTSNLFSLLDFDTILERIKKKAISVMAMEAIDKIRLLTDVPFVIHELTKVTELVGILRYESNFPLEVYDIREDLQIAGLAGSYLTPEGLIRIAYTLSSGKRVHFHLKNRKDKYQELWAIAENITPLEPLENEISRTIDFKTNEVKSSASPALGRIRKEIIKTEQQARQEMDRLFKKYNEKGYLQEALMTLKDGRLVFPVKPENKNKIKGLFHEQSATGSTFFIEPIESVEFNNEIQNLKHQEQAEIVRILKEITKIVHENLAGISGILDILIEFDFIFAKARFALELNCVQPQFNDKNQIEIINGKHPLLLIHKSDAVVPLNLKLDKNINTLVITGPNAGGKSVTLKTVGLFSLMLQSGIPVPVDPDTTLPFFNKIFADIGDFQSIEDDLSTFSSHINNIKSILEQADSKSLVLLDEIGVGTDPAEGSALSIAILEELTRRGCKTIVTTHHGNLKAFAYNTEGVENGSLEFDVKTLQPTYKFKAGIPGSSYALEISKRLGIPNEILTRSKEFLGTDKQKLEELILDLGKKSQESEKLAKSLELEKIRLKGLTNLYEDKVEAFKKEQTELKKKALFESKQLIDQSNAIIENAVKEIKERQASKEAISQAKHDIDEQKKTIDTQLKQVQPADVQSGKPGKPAIVLGETVLWGKQKKTGKIVAIQEQDQKVLLQIESVKFWVPTSELESAPEDAGEKHQKQTVVKTAAKSDVLPEIDVRGNLLEEAINIVDKFIDDALLAGWHEVRIIHGQGTGALRKGLADFFKKHPRITDTHMAGWNEGDLGVTVVKLD